MSSGSNNGSVTISAVANTTTFTRICIITFSASGVNPNLTYVLTQGAAAAFLTISKTTDNIVSTGGSVSAITVSSNTNWTASISSAAWCSLSSSSGINNGSVIVSAIANPTISSRTCVVTFTASSGTSTYNLVQAAGGATLSIDRTSVTLTKAAGSYIVNVSSNTSWTVSANSPLWCSLSSASGSNNGSVTINATGNSSYLRNCVVTFSASGVNTNPTFTLTQIGSEPYINAYFFSNKLKTLAKESLTYTFIIVDAESDLRWNVSSGCRIETALGGGFDGATGNKSFVLVPNGSNKCDVTISVPNFPNLTQKLYYVKPSANIVDLDGDGLIEIDSITKLANILFNENGTSYKTSAAATGLTGGCPASGCNGYELAVDLDFNGSIYANGGGSTWPLINLTNATFNGNGFRIDNFYSNTNGFLSIANRITISNLGLTNVNVSPGSFVLSFGVLVGLVSGTSSQRSIIQNIYVQGNIDASNTILSGSLVGYASGYTTIQNVYANVTAVGGSGGNTGGIVGTARESNISVINSYVTGTMVADRSTNIVAGVVGGFGHSGNIFSNNISTLNISVNQSTINSNYVGSLLGALAGGSSVDIRGINYYTDAKGTNGFYNLAGAGTTSCPATVCIQKTVAEIQALKSTDAPYSSWGTTNWDFTNKTVLGYPALKTTTGVRISGQ